MKKIIFNIFIIFLPSLVFSQVDDIEKVLSDGDFPKAMSLIQKAYYSDTNNSDRYLCLYKYYISEGNNESDSLLAYDYLLKYNNLSKKKIATDNLAKEILSYVYRTKDIDKFNYYISLTQDKKDLNSEAIRIRNQLAYDKVKASGSISMYRNFVKSYTDAVQCNEANDWLNEHLIDYYVNNKDIDSLKFFASNTKSETYKQKALNQIDRMSFHKALKVNTMDSYAEYIKNFPNGAYVSMAKNNYQKVQYEHYVLEGRITDMVTYLDTRPKSDKNYDEILENLKLQALEHYSLTAMRKVFDITKDTLLLERFAKRFSADLVLNDIDILLEEFPVLNENKVVLENKRKAQILQSLNYKQKLALSDYTKHKAFYKNLNAWGTIQSFARFEEINSQQPKSKQINFSLNYDYNYMQFKNAQNHEFDFVLTDKSSYISVAESNYRLISKADTNGYGWYPGSKTRDIFVSLYENGIWGEFFALPSNINSRYDECNAVLSEDKKTLWFSSNRGLNFGKLDIYVSFREDVNDWNNWSEPVLLGEDFNTVDNDYVVAVTDNMVVLSQDEEKNPENFIYLEGNTKFDKVCGKINMEASSAVEHTKIYIVDTKTLNTINIIHPNADGYYCFIKPNEDFMVYGSRKHYFSYLDTVVRMHYIEEMVSKQQLVTIASPFDDKGYFTKIGKKNIELLAKSFEATPYILTIGVHALKPMSIGDEKTLSEKEAAQLIDLLVKNGMSRDKIVVTAYGRDNIMQGWENKSSIDIGVINK